jgi:hypothetical protein
MFKRWYLNYILKTDCLSADQELSSPSCSQNFISACNNPPPDIVLSYLTSVHTITIYSFNAHFNIILLTKSVSKNCYLCHDKYSSQFGFLRQVL